HVARRAAAPRGRARRWTRVRRAARPRRRGAPRFARQRRTEPRSRRMRAVERAYRGAKNDLRLHALGVFSVAVAFLCLGATLLAVVNVDHARERWASFGRASVYLVRGASAEQVSAIERALRASDGVTSVRHVSAEDARRDAAAAGKDPVIDALPNE